MPIGPIRASMRSLSHCCESSSETTSVACRAMAGTGSSLPKKATPTAVVSTATSIAAAMSGSRSAGWSSRGGKACRPPRVRSIAETTPTTSSTEPAGRRTRRGPGRRRRSPSPTWTPSSRSSDRRSARRSSGRSSAVGAATSMCAWPRLAHTRRVWRASGGSNMPRAAVPSWPTCPSGMGSDPVTRVPTARVPVTAASCARCREPPATAVPVSTAARANLAAVRVGSARRPDVATTGAAASAAPVTVTRAANSAAAHAARSGLGSPIGPPVTTVTRTLRRPGASGRPSRRPAVRSPRAGTPAEATAARRRGGRPWCGFGDDPAAPPRPGSGNAQTKSGSASARPARSRICSSEGRLSKRSAASSSRGRISTSPVVSRNASGRPSTQCDGEVDVRLLAQRLVPGRRGVLAAVPAAAGQALDRLQRDAALGADGGQRLERLGVARVLHLHVVVGREHGVERRTAPGSAGASPAPTGRGR